MFTRAVLAVSGCLLASSAGAAAVGIGIEAGIEPETRKLLANYPALVRQEIQRTIDVVLDRADSSVVLWIARTSKAIDDGVANLSCTVRANLQRGPRDLYYGLGLRGEPQPATELQAKLEKLHTNIAPDSAPVHYADALADFNGSVALAICANQTALNHDQVEQLKRKQAAVRPALYMWRALQNDACTNIEECYAHLHGLAAAVLRAADKRDDDAVQAGARFRRLSATMPAANEWLSWWYDDPYPSHWHAEKAMVEMFAIIHDVAAASYLRMRSALELAGRAEKKLDQAVAHLGEAKRLIDRHYRFRYCLAAGSARAAEGIALIEGIEGRPGILSDLSSAESLYPRAKQAYEPIRAKVEPNLRELRWVVTEVSERLKKTNDAIWDSTPCP